MCDNYVQVPRSIILNKDLSEKRVLLLLAAVFSKWDGANYESLTNYTLYSGFRGKDGIINQYKSLIKEFVASGYLSPTDRGMVYTKKDKHYGIIYYSEFLKILNSREEYKKCGKRLNHANVILLLAYLRLYINKGRNAPAYYSDLLYRISDNTGLSVRTISSCLSVLEELDIIHSEELPRYNIDGHWHSNVRIFVNMSKGLEQCNWQQETLKGIFHIRARQIE